jgi:purine nucleosidase
MPADHEITQPEPASAATFFQKMAEGTDKYTVFCLGPLTNIAEALTNNPDLPKKIGQLVIMGGAFTAAGANVSPYAEFNFYNDPLAVQVTLDTAYEAGINTTIIPGEVCKDVTLTEADLTQLAEQDLLPDLRAIVGPYLGYYLRPEAKGQHSGAILYDVLVPLYYLHPELFATSPERITVAQQFPRKGQTIATPDSLSKIQIARSVDVAAARTQVLKILTGTGAAL